MIRINLLPQRRTKSNETVQQQLLAFAAALVIVLVVCFFWWAVVSKEEETRVATLAAKQQELAQLDKIIGEVNEFTAKKKELEDKLAVIQDLKKGKTGPVRALDDLAVEIPNRVWLTTMVEAAGSVSFDGVAVDHEDVSAFMKSLQKSKYFSGVVLGYSKVGQLQNGTQFYEFRITCSVNYAA